MKTHNTTENAVSATIANKYDCKGIILNAPVCERKIVLHTLFYSKLIVEYLSDVYQFQHV